MTYGGERSGAGRPLHFTFAERLAIANAVTLVQRRHRTSKSNALRILEQEGVIPPASSAALARYLTPKYLAADILKILQTHDRDGILTLLGSPKKRTKKGT